MQVVIFILFFVFCYSGEVFSQPSKISNTQDSAKDSISNAFKDSLKIRPKGGIDKPIVYQAKDSIRFELQNRKVFLYNEASVVYGSIDLKAYYIEVNLVNKEIFARGGLDSNGKYSQLPVLKDNGETYTADSMRYNSVSRKGRVYGLRLVQDETYIQLNKVLKSADGSFVGQSGKVTTCEDPHPHFYLNTSKIKVIPNNKVLFGFSNIVLEDVPTPVAIPFGFAPLKKGRKNGLIFPGFGYNQFRQSMQLQNLGYYMGLGKHADLSLIGDAYFSGDYRISAATRFVKKYKYNGNLTASFSSFGSGEVASPTYSKERLFKITGGFNIDPKKWPGSSFGGTLDIGSGNYNRFNGQAISNVAQNSFNSGINFSKSFLKNKINLTASMRHTQNTQTRDIQFSLPDVTIGIPRITPFARKKQVGSLRWYEQINFSYTGDFENNLKTKDTLLFSSQFNEVISNNLSNGFRHTIPVATNLKLFKGTVNLNPSFNYSEIWYFNKTFKYYDDSLYTVQQRSSLTRLNQYNVSIGLQTNIYGTSKAFKLGKMRQLRQTISPSLSAVYSPDFQEKYRRYESMVQVNDTGATESYHYFERGIFSYPNSSENGGINLTIGSNLQAKISKGKDSTGRDQLEKIALIDRFNFSGNYNFLADSLKMSDFDFSFGTMLLGKIGINANALYSPYKHVLDSNGREIKINTLYISESWKLALFKNFRISLNASINPKTFKSTSERASAEKDNDKYDQGMLQNVINQPSAYYDFTIPWNFTLNYTLTADRANGLRQVSSHNINFDGDITVAPEWIVRFSGGYDIKNRRVANSQIKVARNLHCWQMEFTWTPDGFQKGWVFTLRPKSGLLQDLKLNKRVTPYF